MLKNIKFYLKTNIPRKYVENSPKINSNGVCSKHNYNPVKHRINRSKKQKNKINKMRMYWNPSADCERYHVCY